MSTTAFRRECVVTVFALLLVAAPPSQAADAVKITGVSVGLPTRSRPTDHNDPGVAKFGAWAPVYVSLEILSAVREPAELVLEAPDPDEVNTILVLPLDLNGIAPGRRVALQERGVVGYVRPAGRASEITVTVRTRTGEPLAVPHRVPLRPREPLQYVVLALGGAPAGFELPRPLLGGTEVGPLRSGRVEVAHIANFDDLPDHWFGYESADLLLLNTGTATDTFLTNLGEANTPDAIRRREALLEAIRRGGRIVIAVGENAHRVAQLSHLQPLLPYAIHPTEPARTTDVVGLDWSAAGSTQADIKSGVLGVKGGPPFKMANLIPAEKPARVVIPPPARPSKERPVIAAQKAWGLGRVTVIGFDLDGAPLADSPQRAEFWDWVLREGGAFRASLGGDGKPRPPGALTEEEDEAAVAIRLSNDAFDGVAVVSFGWIAVFIGLYLLLIGPVEYFFLQRILGRLELTWITFPIIVLTVSVLAYLTADAIKGHELRINKVDVVEIDPASHRLYGTTWLTIFSPKIDTYTIALTPNDGWGHPPLPTTIAAIGAPRAGRSGIVRRKYTIHATQATLADSLIDVPIQVWSTKALAANWSSHCATDKSASLVSADLIHPPADRSKVVGTFRHDLPVPALTDCVAFYGGMAYPLPGAVIVRGQPVRLVLDQGTPAVQWLQTHGQLENLLTRVQSYAERPGQRLAQRQQLPSLAGPLPLWSVLFHEGTLKNEEGVYARNASLRRLDQSWRLVPDNRDEVIVVGRVPPRRGAAEDVLCGPDSPSQLWLNNGPRDGGRTALPGIGRQETWVRLYLPVR
ncbi:MAG: hypothetical protein RMJ56_14730 [Gemmataceae bacterium]|nr:hypothetical protein [Gemmata sp.]MDW8198850.1 hypothetical protein [Gemmataceae bacterium]